MGQITYSDFEKCITDISIQKTTLLFLHKPEEKKILLGMKKRRFGKGMEWNWWKIK